jgi:Short C-terminal domain
MVKAASKRSSLWQRVGGFLLIFAFVYLVVGVIFRPIMPAPVHMLLDGVFDALLCGPDEEYQQDPFLRGTMRRNIVGAGDAWCLNPQGVKRDISYSEFNVAVALFVFPLLVGFILIIANIPTPSRARSRPSGAGNDLSARLQELKAAYDKGLITSEEYETTRQNILKQMEQ